MIQLLSKIDKNSLLYSDLAYIGQIKFDVDTNEEAFSKLLSSGTFLVDVLKNLKSDYLHDIDCVGEDFCTKNMQETVLQIENLLTFKNKKYV